MLMESGIDTLLITGYLKKRVTNGIIPSGMPIPHLRIRTNRLLSFAGISP